MAWTATGYRFATLRLPTPGAGLDDQDRYALASGVVVGDPNKKFSAQDRFWAARLPAPGDGMVFGDRLAIAGGFSAELEEALVIELFETVYTVDYTAITTELPQSVGGQMQAGFAPIVATLAGQVTFIDPETTITASPDNDLIRVYAESDVVTVSHGFSDNGILKVID